KIKKSADNLSLALVKNPDILAHLASRFRSLKARCFALGFAAETEQLARHAQAKLQAKGLDAIAANDVSVPGLGFNSDNTPCCLLIGRAQLHSIHAAKYSWARPWWPGLPSGFRTICPEESFVNSSLKRTKKSDKLNKSKALPIKAQLLAWVAEHPHKAFVALAVALVLVVDAALGYFAWQRLVVQERAEQLDKLSQQQARKLSVNLGNFMDATQKKVVFFAQNAELAASLSRHDDLALKEFHRAIQNQLPKAEDIRLIPVGEAQLDQNAKIPISFLELQLIKAAEQRQPQKIEAVKLPIGWRVHIILPVPSQADQPVAGTLMITLSMDELEQALVEGVAGLGQISLLQLYDKTNTHTLYTTGQGSLPPSVRREVHATAWLVEFLANESLAAQIEGNHFMLIFEAVIAFLASMLLAVGLGRLLAGRWEAKQAALISRDETTGGKTKDITTVKIHSGHEALLGLNINKDVKETAGDTAAAAEPQAPDQVPTEIFRAYDIRGLVEEQINKELAYKIGQALGSEALDAGQGTLVVAKDARTHSPLLAEYLIRGIISTGCKALNIGTVPTPLLYFATETLGYTQSGVVVTASHNPANYNGFKLVLNGKARMEDDIQAVRRRIEARDFRMGMGQEEHLDIMPAYIDAIYSDVALAGDVSIVLDAGNGVTGKVAPRLFEELGCQVTSLYCDLDGTFPNHGPDPTVEANLADLIAKVKEENADLGVAFDGDGDRLVVVTSSGQIIWPDRLLMLFAKDILARNPGADVVFDVKSSRLLTSVVASQG
ncbi:MAG TPA: phosphopantothenoylcysteine decarboxylase, partial [Cellvibrionaceae bacterium]|nr:phosphopantothenoylcysteine decarboxylase [Cellvibrionaceae bacterium]